VEATERPVHVAGFWLRGVALALELVFALILSAIASVIVPPLAALLWVLVAAYFVLSWSSLGHGQTLGMSPFRIRVVRTDGSMVSLVRASLRVIVLVAGTVFWFIGLLWAAFDGRGQGWHDKVAGTIVVRGWRQELPADLSMTGPFACGFCPQRAPDADVLRQHLRETHGFTVLSTPTGVHSRLRHVALAVATVAAFSYGFLWLSASTSGPADLNCIGQSAAVAGSPTPDGLLFQSGTVFTQPLHIRDGVRIAWSKTGGTLYIQAFDASASVTRDTNPLTQPFGRGSLNTVGYLGEVLGSRAQSDQFTGDAGVQELRFVGEACLTFSSGYSYDPKVDVNKLPAPRWRAIVTDLH
jgi:uncharacterized RDD family membrane protein YckC